MQSGKWQEENSGIGYNSDSFYEYLIKYYVLHQDEDFWIMFKTAYAGIFNNSGWMMDLKIEFYLRILETLTL